MIAHYIKYTLQFKIPAGTSRGTLQSKDTYFLIIENKGKTGVGECAMFKGLSIDDRPDYEEKLQWVCDSLSNNDFMVLHKLTEFPSIQFGIEQAIISLGSSNQFDLYPSEFTRGNASILINGLIWIGDEAFMLRQVDEKIKAGFTTIKLKIGALDFEKELSMLKSIREKYTSNDIEIRLDANGAFTPENALDKLNQLAKFSIHSIEQPIKPKQWNIMAQLCEQSPIPIALDEELIGVFNQHDKIELLETIKPQFLILKPSLLGGIGGCNSWIQLCSNQRIGWWITSALESNIGLNAIAQYTFNLGNTLPQGLGTGGLFTNNFESPLTVQNGYLKYNPSISWNVNL
ncbi:MAG: o-succinylbenzoate synthase [Flavobacteriaceae bacterium]|nr:o-succinylbenzoate synthase [Flavobacteriaceae bacterium]